MFKKKERKASLLKLILDAVGCVVVVVRALRPGAGNGGFKYRVLEESERE